MATTRGGKPQSQYRCSFCGKTQEMFAVLSQVRVLFIYAMNAWSFAGR